MAFEKKLSDDDQMVWDIVAKTVKPFRKTLFSYRISVAASKKDNSKSTSDIKNKKIKSPQCRVFLSYKDKHTTGKKNYPIHINQRRPGLDNHLWRQFKAGKLPIDGRIDLHGYSVQEAYEAFLSFMYSVRIRNARCVEVITGLGSGVHGGAIRREMPHWLEKGTIKPFILAVVHPNHVNRGALRILLKKRKID